MAPSTPQVPHTRPLLRCPIFPTTHTLPSAVTAQLDAALFKLHSRGRPARPEDLVSLTVVSFTPDSPKKLMQLMTKPHPALGGTVALLPTGKYRGTLRPPSEQLMLRLPSPVTWRINTLLDALYDSQNFRASRRQLVSAAVLHCMPTTAPALATAWDNYLVTPASAAVVKGRPVAHVLNRRPPKPGRRPLP
jgi:hypothetical protein